MKKIVNQEEPLKAMKLKIVNLVIKKKNGSIKRVSNSNNSIRKRKPNCFPLKRKSSQIINDGKSKKRRLK